MLFFIWCHELKRLKWLLLEYPLKKASSEPKDLYIHQIPLLQNSIGQALSNIPLDCTCSKPIWSHTAQWLSLPSLDCCRHWPIQLWNSDYPDIWQPYWGSIGWQLNSREWWRSIGKAHRKGYYHPSSPFLWSTIDIHRANSIPADVW